MADPGFRIERDSMGEVQVPEGAYYGAQTQRARENFPISGVGLPRQFIRALAMIKYAAAVANEQLGLLDPEVAAVIREAARQIMDGKFDDQFVVDVFQTGSGTSTNMNANEVIANRALEILGKPRGGKQIHPNDHVNLCQSSNDVIPTALHCAARIAIERELLPALTNLRAALQRKAVEFDDVIKIGRTHLADATPMRLGQEFSGYARQIELSIERLQAASAGLKELALGGTAIGTGINAHPEFAQRAVAVLSELTGLEFIEAKNHFEAQAAKDAVVQASGSLKSLAVSLIKIANDLRWLASGPRCGIGEIVIPDLQPGSSIMPGKVNPVLCEAVLQVAAHVIGCDATITFCAQSGNFELNTMMPLMSLRLLEAIDFSANVIRLFSDKCVDGIAADRARSAEMVERSLAMVTALAPLIGYESAAKVAQEALSSGRTVREVAQEKGLLAPEDLERVLDPWRMTEPGIPLRQK
jgi:fumarate hydratase class II